jgi:hypothetical protein
MPPVKTGVGFAADDNMLVRFGRGDCAMSFDVSGGGWWTWQPAAPASSSITICFAVHVRFRGCDVKSIASVRGFC